jgi:hypothetical protein
MKTLQQLCAASVLTLTLSLSAFAGDITTMIVPPPPPSAQQATTAGDISTTKAGEITTMVTSALDLLTSVLSLV